MPFIPKDIMLSSGARNRVAIIGPPGSGKTTSLLTFPNLVVFDRDRNCPPGVTTIPAWNPDWADSLVKRTIKEAPNFRDAIVKWLRENMHQFEPEQTFALDSWTFVQDACDLQTNIEDDLTPVGKSGQRDGFFFWKQKLRFSKDVAEYLKGARCNVVVTMHETIERDSEGKINGKIRPVQDGSYKDYVLGIFNNVWRMRGHMPKNPAQGIAPKNPDGTRKEQELIFYWQLYGDSVIDLKMDSTLGRIARAKGLSRVEISFDESGKPVGGYQTIQKIYEEAQKQASS